MRSVGYPGQVPIVVALLGLGLLSLGWRVWGGHPRPPRGTAHLARREAAFLAAAAEALFPPGGPVPPSGAEAGVVPWCDRWLGVLPADTRRLVRLLLVVGEHGTLLFPAPGWDGARRFSALDPARRARALEGWRQSRWFARRLVFTSLRAIVTQAYFADPTVLRTLSLAPREIRPPRHVADALYPPIGRPLRDVALREQDVEVRGPLDRPPAEDPLGTEGPLHPAYRGPGS